MRDAHCAAIAAPYPLLGSSDLTKAPLRTQIQVAATRAITDLIFNPPPSSSSATKSSSLQLSSSAVSAYPETLYLDHARMGTLSADAADFTSLYMLLMLFRQLVLSAPRASSNTVRPDELLKLKKEIWEIGPAHPGLCFMQGKGRVSRSGRSRDKDREEELKKWQSEMDDVVLQVALRASEARSSLNGSSASTSAAAMSPEEHVLPMSNPHPELMKLADSWASTHLRPASTLSGLLRSRICTQVQETAIGLVVRSSSSPTSSLASEDVCNSSGDSTGPGLANGLEPLAPEIQHLSERIAKLVNIHLDVYGALYAQPGFL